MIILQRNQYIQISLSESVQTNQLQCITSYRDISETNYTPGRTIVNTNNTTKVDLISGNTDISTQRVIDYIRVYNNDTAPSNVTLKYKPLSSGSTTYDMFVTSLAPTESIEYVDGRGFRVLSNIGSEKHFVYNGTPIVSTTLNCAVLANDVINSSSTANAIMDVTGLSFPVLSGKTYHFCFYIYGRTETSTTGFRTSIDGPAFSNLTYTYRTHDQTTTVQALYNQFDNPTSSGTTSSGLFSIIEGIIKPAFSGTVVARVASEIANSPITIYKGSFVYYRSL